MLFDVPLKFISLDMSYNVREIAWTKFHLQMDKVKLDYTHPCEKGA